MGWGSELGIGDDEEDSHVVRAEECIDSDDEILG